MCPQGCGGSSPPFGTNYNNRLASTLRRGYRSDRLVSDFLRDFRCGLSGPLGLRNLVPQIVRREMRVPESHLDVPVAQDRLERLETPAPHDEPGREVVAAVVEV